MVGSSPRVWGQVEYSGKDTTTNKDHPHAYGDKLPRQMLIRPLYGSSPRVWGQEIFELLRGGIYGIIPTRMGTSSGGKTLITIGEDHPHAYGDKLFNVYNI